jgi:hypothetical protein
MSALGEISFNRAAQGRGHARRPLLRLRAIFFYLLAALFTTWRSPYFLAPAN